jgi:hypothetical protein
MSLRESPFKLAKEEDRRTLPSSLRKKHTHVLISEVNPYWQFRGNCIHILNEEEKRIRVECIYKSHKEFKKGKGSIIFFLNIALKTEKRESPGNSHCKCMLHSCNILRCLGPSIRKKGVSFYIPILGMSFLFI